VVRTPTNYQKKGVLPLDFRQQDLQDPDLVSARRGLTLNP
jgi:hypothetical protein